MKDSCYLEEQMRNMIDGMRNQAYIVGQGYKIILLSRD